ncbi:hypothetical protein [Saccharomonospora saliphila]|uniref:hypothetical protein n=1 Tax=Saccharomonospora saliphila TaxID=369829 RepID=UPI000365BA12|nr:hypothetical protein [Saccharomonospora saliphila]
MAGPEVDIEALRTAAAEATHAGKDLSLHATGRMDLDSATGGLAGFSSGSALATAADRWMRFTSDRAELVRFIGDRLSEAVTKYADTDNAAARSLTDIVGRLNEVTTHPGVTPA